jgi:hypothetical protein
VKDEAQQAAQLVPAADVQTLLGSAYGPTHFRGNMVQGYQVLAPPLDKLILDLKVLMVQAQREDIVKQPDLDDAPPSYRPAVSDYFESMSRDYHPDDGGDTTNQP